MIYLLIILVLCFLSFRCFRRRTMPLGKGLLYIKKNIKLLSPEEQESWENINIDELDILYQIVIENHKKNEDIIYGIKCIFPIGNPKNYKAIKIPIDDLPYSGCNYGVTKTWGEKYKTITFKHGEIIFDHLFVHTKNLKRIIKQINQIYESING